MGNVLRNANRSALGLHVRHVFRGNRCRRNRFFDFFRQQSSDLTALTQIVLKVRINFPDVVQQPHDITPIPSPKNFCRPPRFDRHILKMLRKGLPSFRSLIRKGMGISDRHGTPHRFGSGVRPNGSVEKSFFAPYIS